MQDIRVKANQIELQIREYEHDRDAVFFLHFSGANLMMWQPAVPYFQGHYRLILVDLRGHGKSDKPETGYHIDEMARDVVGIMRHLKLDRAHVVGSSLGAEVGLSIAANYPQRVISLVCDGALSSEYGPYGAWEGSEREFEEHAASQLEKMRAKPDQVFPSVDLLVDASRQVMGDWWNEYFEAMERYGAYKVAEGKYRKSLTRGAMTNYMQHYFHCRFEEYYVRVKCPLLMVSGEDALANEREKTAMEGLRGLAEQAQIVTVSGWVHPYGWLLDPEGMCQAVLRFLDGQRIRE